MFRGDTTPLERHDAVTEVQKEHFVKLLARFMR